MGLCREGKNEFWLCLDVDADAAHPASLPLPPPIPSSSSSHCLVPPFGLPPPFLTLSSSLLSKQIAHLPVTSVQGGVNFSPPAPPPLPPCANENGLSALSVSDQRRRDPHAKVTAPAAPHTGNATLPKTFLHLRPLHARGVVQPGVVVLEKLAGR